MKLQTTISILILTLVSCTQSKIDKLILCENEIELLKGNSTLQVDFGLNMDNILENLQSQIDKNICNGVYPLNGHFRLTESETIETLILTEKFCKDDTTYTEQPCVLIRTIQVFINENSQILFDGNLLELDRLSLNIAKKSREFFIKNGYKYAAYQIYWDNKTPIEIRKSVYKEVVSGYLLAANNLSNSIFKKDICQLENEGIENIRRQFRMVVSFKDNLPPLPPPPKGIKYFKTWQDTIEQELTESEIKEE